MILRYSVRLWDNLGGNVGDNSEKKYGSYKIPDRQEYQKTVVKTEEKKPATLSDGLFYEIEYENITLFGNGS